MRLRQRGLPIKADPVSMVNETIKGREVSCSFQSRLEIPAVRRLEWRQHLGGLGLGSYARAPGLLPTIGKEHGH